MKKLFLLMTVSVLSVTGFAQQAISLSQQEKEAILYMREEEKLARDVYDSMYSKWGGNPFGNIRQSEQTHMDKVKALISTFNLQDPVAKNGDRHGVFTNSLLQEYYTKLVSSGSQSLTEGLKAGAKIEELDITDLETRISQTQNKEIAATYNYLKMASENHLRAFVRRLKSQGINYEPVIMNKAAFDKIINSENQRGCENQQGCEKKQGCD